MTITIPGATEWGIEVLVFPPLGVNGAPCGCHLALVGRFAREKEMLLDIEHIRFIVPCYFFGRWKCSKPLGRWLSQSAFGFCLINLPQIVLILASPYYVCFSCSSDSLLAGSSSQNLMQINEILRKTLVFLSDFNPFEFSEMFWRCYLYLRYLCFTKFSKF